VHVVIAGGGVTGLTAAYRLLEGRDRNLSVTVLEASPRLGGALLTVQRDGFLFDGGPDAFVATKPHAKQLCIDLGLRDRLIETEPESRHVYFLRRGKLVRMPEGMVLAVPTKFLPMATSPLFSKLGVARMGLDLLIPRRRDGADESIASFLGRRLGKEVVEMLGEPLLGGIYSGDPARLSIRATFPQLVELEEKHGSLVRGALAMRAKAPKRSGPAPSAFLALKGGMGELIDALATAIRERGGQIHTSTALDSIQKQEIGFRISSVHAGQASTSQADRLLLALPAAQVARLVDPLAPAAARLFRAIPHVSTATCLLAYRREDIPHAMDAAGVLIPKSEGYDASALTFMSSKWAGRASDGTALLRVFFGGQAHPEVRGLTDLDLLHAARETLRSILGVTAEPLTAQVFRWNDCRPQPVVGHLERLSEARACLAAFPGLLFAGGAFDGVGIPDCVRQGEQAAAALSLLPSSSSAN
jgi:oxygen-dependent protoporphyrinogen oxidase